MKQERITKLTALIAAAVKAKGGANEYGAAIGNTYATKAAIEADLNALITARDNHVAGKAELATRSANRASTRLLARRFVTKTRDILKETLGNQYSTAWDVTGFVGGLKVPRSPDALQELVRSLKAYLAGHQNLEVATLNITAAQAQQVLDDLIATDDAVNVQVANLGTLRGVRLAKEEAMRARLAGLVEELGRLIGPLDPRWKAFGLNMPGADAIPDVPANVTVVLVGPTAAAVKWDAAARAERYRIWKRVIGVDAEPVLVDTRADLDVTLEGLPSNAQIEVSVSAINNGGESGRSPVVTVSTV